MVDMIDNRPDRMVRIVSVGDISSFGEVLDFFCEFDDAGTFRLDRHTFGLA